MLVRGVRGEPLLHLERVVQPYEHVVEGVRELAELVVASAELYPVAQVPGRHDHGGLVDAA
jgi:hypothetical protein